MLEWARLSGRERVVEIEFEEVAAQKCSMVESAIVVNFFYLMRCECSLGHYLAPATHGNFFANKMP